MSHSKYTFIKAYIIYIQSFSQVSWKIHSIVLSAFIVITFHIFSNLSIWTRVSFVNIHILVSIDLRLSSLRHSISALFNILSIALSFGR